jgi:RsiW-degrading membrane proteinase PrsW (M82 family)
MLNLAAALAPVVCFLVLLVFMDSFKLVPFRTVGQAMLYGLLAAGVALAINTALLHVVGVPRPFVTRALAPVLEEILKLGFVVYVIRARRVGFPVDAAIVGFAVGSGFALAENVYYLAAHRAASPILWLVRGFGAAVLHAAASAIAAMVAQTLASRRPNWGPSVFVPGTLAAIGIHALHNQFVLPAVVTTLLLIAILPPIVLLTFEHSERATREWVGAGLDLDFELLQLVTSEEFGGTRLGMYLRELRSRFPGPVVGDMFCLLRMELELGIRAKSMLLAREAGVHTPPSADLASALEEVHYLEKSIGPTGLLAIAPLHVSSDRDKWHQFLLREIRR